MVVVVKVVVVIVVLVAAVVYITRKGLSKRKHLIVWMLLITIESFFYVHIIPFLEAPHSIFLTVALERFFCSPSHLNLLVFQLRYTGVLETTRIRRDGYSVRVTFEDFLNRLDLLFPASSVIFVKSLVLFI